jgi:hypothetical protein
VVARAGLRAAPLTAVRLPISYKRPSAKVARPGLLAPVDLDAA